MKKKKRNIRSITTAALIAAMGIAPAVSAVPTYAATTPVAGTKTTFDKYLVMKRNANVPNATFSYTVSIPSDDEMKSLPNPEDTNGTNLTVRKGIGEPTASTTTFAAGDQTFDGKQRVRTDKDSNAYDATADDQVGTDTIKLDETKKYAKHTSTVDFSRVSFSEPGVYRYKITENIPGDNDKEKGITYDSTPRYLDVYVESDDTGTLSIKGYVFHTLNQQQAKGDSKSLGSNNPDGKNKGFTNVYTTKDLTLTKTVTGNQGFRDQFFKFHVDITNLDAGARLFLTGADSNARTTYTTASTVTYAYNATTGGRDDGQKRFAATTGTLADTENVKADNDNKSADSTATTDKAGEADAQGLTITADDSGHAAFDVYLKHGEAMKVNGLTESAKYTVKETSEDYTASATKNGTAIDLTKGHDAKAHTDVTPEQTLAVDETVAFTNDREGVLPTGVIHNNRAALSIAGVAAAGACIAVAVRKQRKAKEKAQKEASLKA